MARRLKISTGTPEKSNPETPEVLDDHPAPPHTPLIRDFGSVVSRSAFEQEVLNVLDDEFTRLNDIARAAARFERQTLEGMKEQRIAEGYDPAEAGDLTSVFDVKDFTSKAEQLVDISTLGRIAGMLGLGPYRDEIIIRLIDDKFGHKSQEKETKQVYLGNYEDAMVRQLRAKAGK